MKQTIITEQPQLSYSLGYDVLSIRQIRQMLKFAIAKSKKFDGKIKDYRTITISNIKIINGYDNAEGMKQLHLGTDFQ